MRFPNPGGFGSIGLFGGVFADILAGLVFIICFVIVVGLLFVLVRFLLVATRAAEIYVAKNSAGRATTTAQPSAPAGTTTTTTSPPVTKPTPRTRKTEPK